MTNTVFYSWQSDSPAKTNRNFIEGVLKRVIKEIGQEEGDVEVAERPLQLDRDTKGVAGSPSIVEAILGKIKNCGVFVPDLTFVGETPTGRPLQNPNVLIEYGWALSQIGDARIYKEERLTVRKRGGHKPAIASRFSKNISVIKSLFGCCRNIVPILCQIEHDKALECRHGLGTK